MDNPTELVRPVRHPRPQPGVTDLMSFQWNTRLIHMYPVSLDELSAQDFRRIHQFWDRLQRLKRGDLRG